MSFRITKAGAEEVAKKLVEKKVQKVAQMRKDFLSLLQEECEAQIPKEVLEFYKEYHPWMNSSSSVYLKGYGFTDSVNYNIPKYLPRKNGGEMLKLDKEIGARLIKSRDAWKDEEKKVNDLFDTIVIALTNLKSFKNIQEHLPEAVPFLPKSSSVELMVNFSDIRKKIKAA